MKILIVLLRLRGGVGRANTELADVLRKEGHHVDILSREDNLKKYSLKSSIRPLRKRVKELMAKENYDVIYTQDYSCTIPLLFPYRIFRKKHFACFCGIKTGQHPTLIQGHHKFTQRIVGRLMGKRLAVIGDSLKRSFPWAKLIYRGVNFEEFKPLRKKRDSLGWTLTDNELVSQEDMEEVSKKLGLKLFVAKDIPKNKMNELYNRCEVFVNLPRTAGFNLAWLEAMAAGVPVIVGNDRGAGSFLPIAKVNSTSPTKEEIIEVLKKTKKFPYRKWLIENKFSWEDKAKELVQFFREGLVKS